MANEGPTTVATINAKITVDAEPAFRSFEEVRSDAKSLGAESPDIKLTASGAEKVAAKLAAVQAAQDKLGQSTQRLTTAQAILGIEETREGRKAALLLPARLEAKAAADAQTTATAELAAAIAALNVAEGAEVATKTKANEANKTNITRMGVIGSLVAALIVSIAPLAGYTIAVAGGFTAMGAAGLLALVGIHAQMTAGTPIGQTYSQGIRTLKGDLQQLSQTAAVEMLGSFKDAVGQVNSAMPFLNTSTRIFTDILGITGSRVLSAVINSLKVLNPLFVSGALYVNQLAGGFQKWTQNGGLQKFVTYAQGALPLVASALGAIANAVVRVFEATAPLGTVTLGVLTAVSNAIAGLPSNQLLAIAAAATGGFIAFKAWGLIAPILGAVATAVGAVGVATEILEGPLGWVSAAVGLLGATLAVATVATQGQKAATDSYAAALMADMGVIGQATEKQAALNLQQANAFELGKKLGLSQVILTAAVLGNVPAQKLVQAAIEKATKAQQDAIAGFHGAAAGAGIATRATGEQADAASKLAAILDDQTMGVQKQIDAYNELQLATNGTAISTETQLNAVKDLAAQYGMSLSDYLAATGAQKQTSDQLAATTRQMQIQNDAAGLLSNAFTILNGGSLNVAQAQTGLAAANNTLTDSLNTNGDVVDGNTKAAVANQQAIQQQVSAAQQMADAVGKQTGSTVAGTKAYTDAKSALEAQLSSQGLLSDAVQTYIDRLYDVKDFKPTTTTFDVNTTNAMVKIAALRAALGSIDPSRVGLTATGSGQLTYSDSRNTAQGHADGGTIYGVGSGTSDSNLRRLSRGEEVIRASAAQQVRPLLKAINTNPGNALASLVAMSSPKASAPQAMQHVTDVTNIQLDSKTIAQSVRQYNRSVATT